MERKPSPFFTPIGHIIKDLPSYPHTRPPDTHAIKQRVEEASGKDALSTGADTEAAYLVCEIKDRLARLEALMRGRREPLSQ